VFIVSYGEDRDFSLITIIAGLVIIGIIAAGAVFAVRLRRKKASDKQINEKIKVLNEKEKAIIGEVLRSPGINQSVLKNKVGLTKSNISKIIAKLEFRALIEKRSEGKINRLYLGEKLKKP
jgi:uncharacterized membrane protein